MSEYASNSYVEKALETLIDTLGVKEEIDGTKLDSLFRQGNLDEGVKVIARQLGLPISINIEYGEKNIQSNSPVRTRNGRGIEGVIAQVRIPDYLPLFGTPGLINYPIKIFIGPDYKNQMPTLLAILAHELSHVLLHSMRSQYCKDEIYTDLVGPILGLAAVIEKGRKTVITEQRRDATFTHTTTYGYLSDEQFDLVKEKVARVLQVRIRSITGLESKIIELKRLCNNSQQSIMNFKKNMGKIAKYPRKRIPEEDAIRLVSIHQSTYLDDFISIMREAENLICQVSEFIKHNRHFTKAIMVEFEKTHQRIETSAGKLISKNVSLNDDIQLMRRSMKLLTKLLE